MGATVALTGASGFIGARLAARLAEKGYRVKALRHRAALPEAASASGLEVVPGGLSDDAALARLCAGADVVVHCAALVRARRARDFQRVNAEGVARLVRAAAGAGSRPRLLLLSSLVAREPGLSDYAASKRAGERVLAEQGSGLEWTVFRPPAVYGPGDRELLRIFRWVRRGFAPLPATAEARFSLVHVDDLVAAMLAWLATPGSAGRAYEVDDGSGDGYRWGEVLEMLAEALEARARPVAPPAPLLHALAAASTLGARLVGQAPMLTPGKLRELRHSDWVCRDRGLREEIGWQPTIGLREGLRQTVAWYRRQGWL